MILPALILLALPPQASDSLLPPAPAGWRTERLAFPLAFAPEIDYRGVEDLAFAPGMFAPDSDSYFSYALALRLEGDVAVDERMLAGFLETYYRGLCRAVGEERKLALDLAAVRARVRRDGALFRATVETFDPFTTGQPLELELELAVHAAPRATEVLGLASPLGPEAPVWRELRELGRAWRAARPAPVFLNHVFAVLDRESYDAIAASSFLRETFAVSEERTTVRTDTSYTGLYFYGQRTYFEFLPPEAAAGFAEGSTGLALGVEAEGGLDAFARELGDRQVRTQLAPITRELDGKQVPWFRILGVELPPAPLALFAMEYDPRFLPGWHADLPPERPGIARADVLERYAAALGRAELRASAPFADVAEVRLALDVPGCERLVAVCAAAGHEVEKGAEGWTITGSQLRIALRLSEAPLGVTGFTLALRMPLEHEPISFGTVELSFHGRTAAFELRP